MSNKRLKTLLGMLETAAEDGNAHELCKSMCEYRVQGIHCDSCPFDSNHTLDITIEEFKKCLD